MFTLLAEPRAHLAQPGTLTWQPAIWQASGRKP